MASATAFVTAAGATGIYVGRAVGESPGQRCREDESDGLDQRAEVDLVGDVALPDSDSIAEVVRLAGRPCSASSPAGSPSQERRTGAGPGRHGQRRSNLASVPPAQGWTHPDKGDVTRAKRRDASLWSRMGPLRGRRNSYAMKLTELMTITATTAMNASSMARGHDR